ncbi:MAG: polysaccharide deacetylase [Thalassobius sp.]|nr:polysaccharide deacetylase [Thalassovita sp.]
MKNYLITIALCVCSTIGYGQVLLKPIPDKTVILTFDDGVSTHATYVAPLLKKYNFDATFFVCEFPPDFEDKKKYMSWEQIKELNEQGFEVANHTWKHTHVNRMSPEECNKELAYIEDKCESLGIPTTNSFAYPAYDTDDYIIDLLKDRGYIFARVGGSRPYNPEVDHPYLIPSYSTTGTNKERVINAIKEAKDGKIVVLTIHGVPDYAHDWVTTPPELFEEYLKYLSENDYHVLALRDLQEYIKVEYALQNLIPDFSKNLKNSN